MGFGFAETMSGTWTRSDGSVGGGAFEFRIEVDSGPLGEFRKSRTARLTGEVDAAGLATARRLEGTLEMRPFFGRRLRYQFEFTGDDGARYGFAGQKDIRWTDAARTWTELPGELTDDGGLVIGTAIARFDLRGQGLAFARSFHWR